MLTKTIIGLDIGRSAVKAIAFANGLYYRLTFPSLVSPAVHLNDDYVRKQAELETVEVAGKRYFTGETANLQGGADMSVGLSDDWIHAPEYLALVASTMQRLAALGVPGLESPYIVLGTPASLFGQHKEVLVELTQQVVSAEMKVLPQPMGAFCSFFMDQRGTPIRERRLRLDGAVKNWAVIEVGHFTTDFLLMKKGQYVERAAASCVGINYAVEELVRILGNKRIKVSAVAAEAALRTKTVFSFGEKDVSNEAAEAAEHVIQKILNTADSVLGNHAGELDGVLLAGGGAPIVAEGLQKKWPHVILLENPRMAVADGFCRFGAGVLLARAQAAEKAIAA